MDKSLDKAPEEQQRSVEKEFWRRNEFRLGSFSQYKPILESLLRNVRELVNNEGLDVSEFKRNLQEAEEIVNDITQALRAFWNDAPDDQYWYGFHERQLAERPTEWTDASPIDPTVLDAATARYLDRPWLQSNLLDWYLLNGFIVDEILRLADSVKSGFVLGKIDWAYVLSEGRSFAQLRWRLGFTAIKFSLKWLLLPGLAAVAYLNYFETAAMWILGVFGILLVVRMFFLPRRFKQYRDRKQVTADAEGKLKQLIKIHKSISVNTLNPTRLRQRLIEAENEGTLVHLAVYCILDRAIVRDPAVFTTSEYAG